MLYFFMNQKKTFAAKINFKSITDVLTVDLMLFPSDVEASDIDETSEILSSCSIFSKIILDFLGVDTSEVVSSSFRKKKVSAR